VLFKGECHFVVMIVYMLQNAVQLVEMFRVCYVLSVITVHNVHM